MSQSAIPDLLAERATDTDIEHQFIKRWSTRAFDGSDVADADLRTIFDAARFAPSAYNYQPWRFLYAHRNGPHFEAFLGGLNEYNQLWAKHASVLIYVLSETTMGDPEKPSYSHSFDAGAAWGYLALQASNLGYYTHGMIGLEFDTLADTLNLPEGWKVEAAIALGRKGDNANLNERMIAQEFAKGRKPIEETAFEGPFPA